MPRPVHFELQAENPERAAKFYTELFGWHFDKWGGPVEYWMITTGPDSEPGINGGMMHRQGSVHGDILIAYVCTIAVDAVDTYVARAEALGGTVVVPKNAIPGVGWIAYCRDTEGNLFGLHTQDPNAK